MTLVAAIERIFIVNTPYKEVSCASAVPRRCLARITYASTNGRRILHARAAQPVERIGQRDPPSHQIAEAPLVAGCLDLMIPCRKWPRSVRYGSPILERIRLGATLSASASLTVMRSFASRKHRLQWKQSASMNMVVIHPAPRQSRATTTHQRAPHACEGSRSGSASRAPSSRMSAESFPRSGRRSFPLLSDDRAIRQTVS